MQFSEVIGQKELKAKLVKMIEANRLSHALLFLEKEGAGGLALARAFAQYIVCENVNKQNTGDSLFGDSLPVLQPEDSCGKCASCIKAAAMIHPDIHFSFPVIPKKSDRPSVSADFMAEFRQYMLANPYSNEYNWLQFINAENKQGNITSRECEEIIRIMGLKSFESEYKILIMWMPEALGNEGNKLLKLIEEPPPNTLFIFVARSEELIIPTILSRVQLVKVPPLERKEIKNALIKRVNATEQQATEISGIAGGNYFEALQLFNHVEENHIGQLKVWLNSILKTGNLSQVKIIDELAKMGRERQKQFLRYFIHLIEHAIRMRALGMEAVADSGNAELNDFAAKFNKFATIEQQEAITNELDKSIYYIERNANAKILFHALTIRLYHIFTHKVVILVN